MTIVAASTTWSLSSIRGHRPNEWQCGTLKVKGCISRDVNHTLRLCYDLSLKPRIARISGREPPLAYLCPFPVRSSYTHDLTAYSNDMRAYIHIEHLPVALLGHLDGKRNSARIKEGEWVSALPVVCLVVLSPARCRGDELERDERKDGYRP
jgi:hypothetical protein